MTLFRGTVSAMAQTRSSRFALVLSRTMSSAACTTVRSRVGHRFQTCSIDFLVEDVVDHAQQVLAGVADAF